MPNRTVTVSLIAEVSNYITNMRSAQKQTQGFGQQAAASAEQARAIVAKVGGSIQSLGNQIGGTVGNLLSTVGSGIDQVASKSAKLSTALEVGGGVSAAAGLGLLQLGSEAKESSDQLKAAIVANGDSYDKYADQIEAAVKRGEDFDHNAEDTKDALAKLVPATNSTAKALADMNVVTDLAAARHLSLSDAATQVARILNGSGARTLTQYGIQMDGVGSKTAQGTRALDELAKKLDGQADASVNNFGKQLDVAETKVGDFIKDNASLGGEVLTGVGVGLNVVGVAIDFWRLRTERANIAQTALNASTDAGAVSMGANAAATDAAALSTGGFAAKISAAASSSALFRGGLVGLAGIMGLDVVNAIYAANDAAAQNEISFNKASDAAAAYRKEVAATTVGFGTAGQGSAGRVSILQSTNAFNKGGFDFANSLGLGSIGGINRPFETINEIDASLADLVKKGNATTAADQFALWERSAKDAGISLDYLKGEFPDYQAALKNYSGTASTAEDRTDDLSSGFSVAKFNADELKASTTDLQKSVATYGQTAQTAESATQQYYAAIDTANESIKTNKKNIDDQTEAGRANNQALYAVAAAADAVAEANIKNKQPLADVQAGLDTAKQKFISIAEAMGYNATQAQALADKLIAVGTFKYNYDDNGIKIATNDLDTYLKDLAKIPNSVNLPVYHGTNGLIGRAGGGILPGQPSVTDNMLVKMASGEGVATSAAMSNPANRAALLAMNSGYSVSSPVYVPAPASSSIAGAYSNSPISIQLTNKSGVAIDDLIDIHIERNNQRHRINLSTGVQRGAL